MPYGKDMIYRDVIDLQKVNEIDHRFNLYDKTDRQNRCQLTHSQILKNRQP